MSELSISDEILYERVLFPPPIASAVVDLGVIRAVPEDFQVEEIPAYDPDGSGDHLFLWVEKRELGAAELVSRVSRVLQISPGDIGVAGQKDRHALTRQFISVPRSAESRIARLADAAVTVLSVCAHRHKLRTGHLRGNRFRIVVRVPAGKERPGNDTDRLLASRGELSLVPCLPDGLTVQLASRLMDIAADGFASYFGPQRFGHGGSTLLDGIALLRGQLSRKRWPWHRQRLMTRLVLSAVQSAVFNLVVSERVMSGTVSAPLEGDVVIRKNGSRPYLYSEKSTLAAEQTSRDSGAAESGAVSETSATQRLIPAGPMPGPDMLVAGTEVAALEANALQLIGLTGDEFGRFRRLCSGTRRPMLQFPENVSVEQTAESHVVLNFELRSGTYATVLLREMFAEIRDASAPKTMPVGGDDLGSNAVEYELETDEG